MQKWDGQDKFLFRFAPTTGRALRYLRTLRTEPLTCDSERLAG